jgi:hypothetical protein
MRRAGRAVALSALGVLVVAWALAGCTTDVPPTAPGVTLERGPSTPQPSFTPVDPGPPPVLTVPPRGEGEVARVVVAPSGSGKAFRNERGEPATEGRTYVVEVACAAGRPSAGTSYAIYDAAPGTWGHGEPLYSRPFPCDGRVQHTVHLGLPAGAVQIDVRGLPDDAVAAYAVIRPE